MSSVELRACLMDGRPSTTKADNLALGPGKRAHIQSIGLRNYSNACHPENWQRAKSTTSVDPTAGFYLSTEPRQRAVLSEVSMGGSPYGFAYDTDLAQTRRELSMGLYSEPSGLSVAVHIENEAALERGQEQEDYYYE